MDLFELINVHIIDWFNKLPERPLIVGLSGPQGCGKTTIVNRLSNDPRVISFSLDDFYYGHEDMMAVANANPDNPFLKFRGCPGTHDLKLLNGNQSYLNYRSITKVSVWYKDLYS